MIVSCPSCTARFNISDASLATGPRKVKCGRCSHVWRVSRAMAMPEQPRPAPRPAPRSAMEPAPAGAAPMPAAASARAASLSAPPQAPARPAGRAERRAGGLWIGWLLLLLVIAGLVAGGWFARGWIVETWPPAERAYDWLGVPLPRIEIAETTERESEEDGTQRLVVGGVLVNNAERELPVPPLVFTLYDARGEPVNQWREAPPVAVLSPGETVEFTSTVGISSGEGAEQPHWEVMLLREDMAPAAEDAAPETAGEGEPEAAPEGEDAAQGADAGADAH
jgi:predicted Zn finger-like uncharacterized protein